MKTADVSQPRCIPKVSVLIEASKIDRHQLTYARFLHCYAVYHINSIHRHFVVRNDDELAVFRKFSDHVCELPHVRIIERRVHFVENTERCGLDEVDRK